MVLVAAAMRFMSNFRFALFRLLVLAACATVTQAADALPRPPPPPASPVIWQATLPDFSDSIYTSSVEQLIAHFEASLGQKIAPGEKGRVGLKIYADSGPGLAGGPHGSLTAVRPLAERLGGTLAWRGCPEGGSAVTLHLPRRGHQRQAA